MHSAGRKNDWTCESGRAGNLDGSGAGLREPTCAGNCVGENESVAPIEEDYAVVVDGPSDISSVGAITDLKGTVTDGGVAGVSIVCGKDDSSRSDRGKVMATVYDVGEDNGTVGGSSNDGVGIETDRSSNGLITCNRGDGRGTI